MSNKKNLTMAVMMLSDEYPWLKPEILEKLLAAAGAGEEEVELLTKFEAASMLKVGYKTVERMAMDGRLERRVITSRAVRVTRRSVIKYLQAAA